MAFVIPTAEAIVGLAHLGLVILEGIQSLDEKRSRFTQDFVTNARNQYPDYNVVIIHTNHSRSGIYIHQHVELDFFLGTTIGYEIYFSKIGDPFDLVNLGDGGYINWAFNGYFNRDGNHISAIVQTPPPPRPPVYAVVYDDSQYRGFSQNLSVGRYDWGQIHNDSISSLRVPAGMKVTLYSDTHFQAKSKTFTQDTPYVGDDFNDITSSIIVE